jgi:hypothetical protein
MIDRKSIIAWSEQFPWSEPSMVEQDLLISRTLVAIFSDEFLASQLAFRGGTALHKLYLSPQPRYSEDIDLVQINPGPIKPIMFRLGEVLSFLPDRVTKQKRYNNTMLFRLESEVPPTNSRNCWVRNCVHCISARRGVTSLTSTLLCYEEKWMLRKSCNAIRSIWSL